MNKFNSEGEYIGTLQASNIGPEPHSFPTPDVYA